MPLTATVTLSDLLDTLSDELADLRDAYDELQALAEDEYGEDAMDQLVPSDPEQASEENRRLSVIQTQAALVNESAKQVQKRQHLLESLREEWASEAFEVSMLTGDDLMQIETELRLEAQARDTTVDQLTGLRQQRVVDAATADAPEEVPRDDDGNPQPSDAPGMLMLSLYEAIERFNDAGDMDFRAPGFDGADPGPVSAPSETQTPAAVQSLHSASDAEPSPRSGDDT